MAEPLSTAQVVSHLFDIMNQARAVEMAITGSEAIRLEEKHALRRTATLLFLQIQDLLSELNETLEKEREGKR